MSSSNNKKEIKNIVIVNDFNYIQGGASKVAIDTANLLVQNNKNFNVYFFSAVKSEQSNLNSKVIEICTNQGEALKDKNRLRGIINGIYNFKAKKEFDKLLKILDRNNTVIHVHGWTKALSSSVFDVAFKKNYKVVLTLHDYFTACPNGGYFDYKQNKICKRKPLSWKCIKCNCDSRNYVFKIYRIVRQFVQNKIVKLPKKLQYAIGISEFSKKILETTLDSSIKIFNVYNPIDFDENIVDIDYKQNDYYLYVGRVSKEKGVDIFCKVITELGEKGIVVGDGSEKDKLEKIYKNIQFVGWKNKNEVKEYMLNARALIFPSRWYETAGLTALEAQSLGIPCITSATCATSEFVNKENIYSTYEELYDKIKKQDFFLNLNFARTNYYDDLLNCYKNLNERI